VKVVPKIGNVKVEVVWDGSVLKAQVSLEFLLILAISLSAFFLYVSAFLKIKNDADNFVKDSYLRNFLVAVEKNVYEVCSLGSGNKRNINVNLLYEIGISSSNKNLKIGNYTITSNCEFESESAKIKNGIIKIENLNGKILLNYSNQLPKETR
jgi:hypothetical protein